NRHSVDDISSLTGEILGVNVEACRKQGVDIVRRRTGGGAVYHDYKGEITYSVIAPAYLFPDPIIESYQHVANWIISGLKTLNVNAEFVPINDLVVNGRKISGNAQTRKGTILQMHGTILFDVDVDTMFSLLNVPDEKMKDKVIQNVKERVTSLKQHGVKKFEHAYEALKKGFLEGKEWTEGSWTEKEKEQADILAREKYGHEEWINSR
ncbi:MAG: biotin/lipoate A/B protein ligase family protein, partial [archaeon]